MDKGVDKRAFLQFFLLQPRCGAYPRLSTPARCHAWGQGAPGSARPCARSLACAASQERLPGGREQDHLRQVLRTDRAGWQTIQPWFHIQEPGGGLGGVQTGQERWCHREAESKKEPTSAWDRHASCLGHPPHFVNALLPFLTHYVCFCLVAHCRGKGTENGTGGSSDGSSNDKLWHALFLLRPDAPASRAHAARTLANGHGITDAAIAAGGGSTNTNGWRRLAYGARPARNACCARAARAATGDRTGSLRASMIETSSSSAA